MSPRPHAPFYPLICLLLVSCGGGGGGGGSDPAPTPPGDTTPPDTTLTSTPPALSNQRRGNFNATSNESGVLFEVSVNGGPYTSGQAFGIIILEILQDGEFIVNVRARDAAGNADPTPASFRWTIDTQAPDTTVATTTGARSNSPAATFTLTSSETSGTFEASIDGGPYATVVSPWALTGLADGAHSISVRAVDRVTNSDPTPATFAWQIDQTAPTARVVFPTSVSYTDATQLHVRGTAQDANGVTSLSVNGVAATTSDSFGHWSAAVPLQVGDNAVVVSATDAFGNINAAAASVAVTNRGVVTNDIMSLAYDAAGGRLLVIDPESRALLAVRVSDRRVSVVSDASRGTGTELQQPYELVLDGARALVTDISLDTLIAIDLATGNRTLLSASPAQMNLMVGSALTYHAPTQRAFIGTHDGHVVAIDLANGGTRTVLSGGGTGTGPAFSNIRGLAIDSTSGTARLLVADGVAHAIIAVDLATGNRTTLSLAAPGNPGSQVGSGPALYNLGQIAVDAAANRVLVPDVSSSVLGGRLISIDLATGNRTVLATSNSTVELTFPGSLAFDPTGGQVYIGMSERARVVRYDIAGAQLAAFVDSNVGTGPLLSFPSGILLDRASGNAALYSPALYPVPTLYRTDVTTGNRFAVANYQPNALEGPGNLVRDTRAGLTNKALFLDMLFTPILSLYGVDLVSGELSLLRSASLPDTRGMSRMAFDADNNRIIVGLMPPSGAGSIEAMNITSGALTTLASMSVGGGPPMFSIGAVVPVPSTFGTTARVLVGADNNLLAVNGQGDRNFISAAGNIGSGPTLITIDDMVVDFPRNRALVVNGNSQAMQWVDLTSGNRTMASGRNPDNLGVRGSGPPLSNPRVRLEADFESNIAYVTVMRTAILAVDLESGDRVLMSR